MGARPLAHHRAGALFERLRRKALSIHAGSLECKEHETLLHASRIVFQSRHLQRGGSGRQRLTERDAFQQVAQRHLN